MPRQKSNFKTLLDKDKSGVNSCEKLSLFSDQGIERYTLYTKVCKVKNDTSSEDIKKGIFTYIFTKK